MPLFKQLLLAVLVFCTLGYSSAWAFDEHAIEHLEVEVINLSDIDANITNAGTLNTEQSHKQNVTDVTCDHCCHISAHLVAIFSDARCQSIVTTSIFLSSLTIAFHSFGVSPDLKPPRV